MVSLKRFGTLLFCLTLWRLVSVFVIQTAHVPDEYWQSEEVAHRLAFGYGYLTWEWHEGIRSYIYPFFISLIYRMLGFCHLDYVQFLTTLPRILQALLAAYADYRLYDWTRSKWVLFSICANWYWYYCAPRILLNTLETSLTTIALTIFPWRDSGERSIKYLWIVALLCAIRPTAAVIWTPLCFYHILTTPSSKIILLLNYFKIGIVTLTLSTILDSHCYGTFVITPLEFLRANIFNQIGSFYGSHSTFWYITSGLPVILGLNYLTFLIGTWQVIKHPTRFHRQAVMLVTIGWTIGIYSLIAHKEFRFILPLLPLLICLSAVGTLCLKEALSSFKRKIFIAAFVLTNLLPGIYFCLIHQRGSLDAMKILQQEIAGARYYDVDILFLTPCHATPLYSQLHSNVSVRFLSCEPNLKWHKNYVDEATSFFSGPMLWLNETYGMREKEDKPSHIVMFDKIAPEIDKFLNEYELIAKLFYAHFVEDGYSQYLLLYRKK